MMDYSRFDLQIQAQDVGLCVCFSVFAEEKGNIGKRREKEKGEVEALKK